MTVVNPSLCQRRCALTIAGAQVAETATYAMLFDGSGNSAKFGVRLPDELFDRSQSDGGDICFSSDYSGSYQLPVELVYIDKAGKKAEIWVAVPLTAGVDKTIYIWYHSKSGTITQPPATDSNGSQAVWNGARGVGNMVAVYHFGTPTAQSGADSTVHGQNMNCGAPAGDGHIGGQLTENGDGNYQAYTNNANTFPASAGGITTQCWFKTTSNPGGNTGSMAGYGCNNWTGCRWNHWFTGTQLGIECCGVGAWADWTYDNNWHYMVGTKPTGTTDLANAQLYLDGAAMAMATRSGTLSVGGGTISCGVIPGYNGYYFPGLIDEFRICDTQRSADYIATDYKIQNSTALVTVGTPNTPSGVRRRRDRHALAAPSSLPAGHQRYPGRGDRHLCRALLR